MNTDLIHPVNKVTFLIHPVEKSLVFGCSTLSNRQVKTVILKKNYSESVTLVGSAFEE